MRLFIEIIGWIVTAYGAIYVFGENPSAIHYIIMGIGIIILLFSLPFKHFRFKKNER